MTDQTKKLQRISRYCETLDITSRTYYRWVKAGKIPPPVKLPNGMSRVDVEATDKALNLVEGASA